MTRSRSYKEDLLKTLQDPAEAREYINAALEDGDPHVFLLALRDVAEARGEISVLEKETQMNRQHLYRVLSAEGNPELNSLMMILGALGYRFVVEEQPDLNAPRPVTQ